MDWDCRDVRFVPKADSCTATINATLRTGIAELADVSSTQPSLHPVARQGQFSDALASRIGESIHDRGNRRPLRTFASAERFLGWTVDELDLNVRHVPHCQDRIALPITRRDPIAVEADLLVQCPTCRLDDATLNLIG
jgi:hypothetical protein